MGYVALSLFDWGERNGSYIGLDNAASGFYVGDKTSAPCKLVERCGGIWVWGEVQLGVILVHMSKSEDHCGTTLFCTVVLVVSVLINGKLVNLGKLA